jgi:hypothetical protein
MKRSKLKPVEVTVPLKLDLGCGKNKQPGFHGVDVLKFDGVDTVLDLSSGSWPWADNSIDEVHSSHFVEHLESPQRVHFFNELYRVLRDGAKATIIVPHWSNERAYGDPTHKWPPVVGFFWYYMSREWRASNAPHTGLTCNFEAQWGPTFGPPWTLKNPEMQSFAMNHYINAAQDMVSTLTKRV